MTSRLDSIHQWEGVACHVIFGRQENKLARLASYRQLQAVSHQLHLSTNGALSLDSFKAPDFLHLEPVKPGEKRGTRIDANSGKVCAFHVAGNDSRDVVNDDGADDDLVSEKLLLPPNDNWWAQLPLLTLQLDQGGTGTAGAAHH